MEITAVVVVAERVPEGAPLLRTGAVTSAPTVTSTSSLAESALSEAERRRTYTPDAEKVTVVDALLADANVTMPGPDTALHEMETVPTGRPSFVTEPGNEVEFAGNVRVLSIPADTTGAVLGAGAPVVNVWSEDCARLPA